MTAMSPRESVLALITGMLLLIAVSSLVARPRIERWFDLRDQRQAVATDIEMQQRIVASREPWLAQYRELSRNIPLYAADQKMDVFLRSLMDRIAGDHNLTILKREIGNETALGSDLFEMAIRADWSGNLEALTGFLTALQIEDKVIMDIRRLHIDPPNRSRMPPMQGRFNLVCIYSRRGATPGPESAPPKPQSNEHRPEANRL